MLSALSFDNSYARLPDRFYARLRPTPVESPRLLAFNRELAAMLGITSDGIRDEEAAAVLSGNELAPGSEPLAQAYAGHQFGNFVPQLGDGRALLLGEVIDRDGKRRDLQLKGSGPTPFSRGGDGRAVLGPVLREYLVSEAMHALGIPTTRALAAVATGEAVFRDTALPGAVLTRVAASHVRVGTFEYFWARADAAALRLLVDYVIDRHYPDVADSGNRPLALLRSVMKRQAALVARWLGVGFIHGVMNTDNTSISGETIDYGPCAFMDAYDPATVFSSIDRRGRYAYGAQPSIIAWNMARLAETLLPLIDRDEQAALTAAEELVREFPEMMGEAWLQVMREKLGLATALDEDVGLVRSLFAAMLEGKADFTNTFRALCGAAQDESADATVRELFERPELCDAWLVRWRERLAGEPLGGDERSARMRRANPAYIPRNHRVEEVLAAALDGDLGPFEELHALLSRPYEDQPELAHYRQPAPPSSCPYRTFCGT